MKRFLAVVEGPHDAAFLGVELRGRGFDRIEAIDLVDDFWKVLIPRAFPAGAKLEHVVRYPDIYRTSDARDWSCAILVAGGDSRLVSELRATLERVAVPDLAGIIIVADADDRPAAHRHAQLCKGLEALNRSHSPGGAEGGNGGVPGFPLQIPQFAAVVPGPPSLGIYVLPDNNRPGTLDMLLLECAQTSFAAISASAVGFVQAADTAVALDARFKALRKPSGKEKASAGAIGNLLFPGSALSAAIDRGNWHNPRQGNERSLNAFQAFCDIFFV